MSAILRTTYQGMLRLHPAVFREEFGEEMLWIFDEECRCGRGLAVMLDGVRSIVVQNVRPHLEPKRFQTAGLYYQEIDSSLPAERIAQAWLIGLSCTLSLTLFFSMIIPVVAMPIGRILYTKIHGVSPASERLHSNTSWRHRSESTTHR